MTHNCKGRQPVCFFNLGWPVIWPGPRWVRTDGTKSKRWEMKEIHLSPMGWQDWIWARQATMKQEPCSTYVMLFQFVPEGCHDTHFPISCKKISETWCHMMLENWKHPGSQQIHQSFKASWQIQSHEITSKFKFFFFLLYLITSSCKC